MAKKEVNAEAPKKEVKTAKCMVLRNFKHDGVKYAIGDEFHGKDTLKELFISKGLIS